MEEIYSSVDDKSNILEHSDCQEVKGVTHQRNNSFFQLPKNIIKRRQRAWSKLFDKYDKEISDYEINMFKLGSDIDDNEENVDHKPEQTAGDVEEKSYFIKNRTPIRKIPALVQYWVDTGNPPFQLNLENDEYESSLSEDQKSSPLIIHTHKSASEGKHDHSTSFFSSVDTAAYILSNANVTKKADTLAIVEGAKKSDSLIEANNTILNNSKESTSTNETKNILKRNNYNTSSRRTFIDYMNGSNLTAMKSHLLTALDPNNIRNKKLISNENCDKFVDKLILQTSVKITDVLPTLEQLDKTLTESTSDNDELSNIISLKDTSKSISGQPLARKKLYTKRESPIDLIISNPRNSFKPRFTTNILHPALQATPTINASRLYFRRRTLRYSKKRTSIDKSKPKRLSNKSHLSSLITKPSSYKRSEAKSINSNHSIINNSIKNSVVITDDQMGNNERKQDLVELCKKDNLVIRLERISNDKLINENIHVEDAEKSSTKTSRNNSHILELDSQESDQSTIIICECNDKKDSLLQKNSLICFDNESMYLGDNHKKKSIKLLNNELQNTDRAIFPNNNKLIITEDEEFSDVFIGKFNKVANPSVLTEMLVLSNREEETSPSFDKSKKTDVNIQLPFFEKSKNLENSEDQSWKLQLTFSSDEEDDFVQMIRPKTETNKIRQTQFKDKLPRDTNEMEQVSSNHNNESNYPFKFEVIASSDDDETKSIKVDNISKKERSFRIRSCSKNVITEFFDDQAIRNETISKQKNKSTSSYRKRSSKQLGKKIVENNSTQDNSKKEISRISVKLDFNASDLSSNMITPPKKLKIAQNNILNSKKKQVINAVTSSNGSIISLKDYSLNKKNLNGLIRRNLTVKTDRKLQSKILKRSIPKSRNDGKVHKFENHENQFSRKKHILDKRCSIPTIKYSKPLEDVIDSGLSSIVSSNDKISRQISNEKFTYNNHDSTNINSVDKRNRNSRRSLKKKSNISVKQNLSKSAKKFIEEFKKTSAKKESDSEYDLTPRIRRQFAIDTSNSTNSMNAQEKLNFDTLFPDPINDSDVLEITIFSSRSKRSRNKNTEKNFINETLSSSRLRDSKMKFHTGMCSDSDSN